MSKLENFKYSRWFRRGHSFVQFILVITLFVGLNILSVTHYKRYDITESRKFSLSPETISYIKSLAEPIDIIVTQGSDSSTDTESMNKDIKHLIEEYIYIANNATGITINTELINVYQQRSKAQQLAEKFGLNQPDLIIFATKNKHKVLRPIELYEEENNERTTFRGEQMFTSALIEVSSPQDNKVYFLSGHGEKSIDSVDTDQGLSQITQELRQRNFKIDSLDITGGNSKIPEDADVIVIAGARTPLLAREVNLIKDYLNENAGRLIVMVDPFININLNDIFYYWGVMSDDMIVLDAAPDALMAGGDLLLRRFDPDHPITKSFAANQLSVRVGLSRPVRLDLGAPIDDRLKVTPIVGGSEQSWGERAYRIKGRASYDEGADLKGPVSIAVVAERKISSDLGIDIPGGRMVVFGTSNLINNKNIMEIGNFALFLNTLNWTLDRNNLLTIPPKPISKLHITLSQKEMSRLRLLILLLLPVLAALFGTIIYWIRRN